MTVIYARGATEAENVGFLTEPPFFSALEQIMGKENVTVQGASWILLSMVFYKAVMAVVQTWCKKSLLYYPKTPYS
jgi:hypothetical protein